MLNELKYVNNDSNLENSTLDIVYEISHKYMVLEIPVHKMHGCY